MPLSAHSRIVFGDADLAPLGRVLAEEIKCLTGLTLAVEQANQAHRGDIILSIDSSFSKEAYRLEITDEAMVRGGNYGGIALGTATLLQAVAIKEKMISLPRMLIEERAEE